MRPSPDLGFGSDSLSDVDGDVIDDRVVSSPSRIGCGTHRTEQQRGRSGRAKPTPRTSILGRLLGIVFTLVVLASSAPPAAAILGDGWLPGPGAMGDNAYSGIVDMPVMKDQVMRAGAVRVSGWFLDRTASGWAGADDVEIYLGTMANGGVLLAHAQFAQDRPDVAGTFGRADWLASGWSASVSTDTLLPGPNVLSVYAHSPAKGWWYTQVTIQVDPLATRRPLITNEGFDISFPQCGGPEPPAAAFGVLGVTGGRAFTGNPCLARQYVWAQTAGSGSQPRASFYMNTGNPGPEVSTHWPPVGTAMPKPCDGSATAACAFDYGWLAAQDAYARARSVAGDGASLAPWWLDVEVANSWSADRASNAAALQGAVAFLRSVNVPAIGIYTAPADWTEIVGEAAASSSQLVDLPNWRPGATNRADAPRWCSRTVTGGKVLFVQYTNGAFDANLPCP